MRTLIDLTQLLNENISVYPDTIGPSIRPVNTVARDGFAELKVDMVLHSGTHIDAPNHVLQDGRSLDEFPLEKFTGSAVVISCVGESEIGLSFLEKHREKIASHDFVLFYTGWQHKWGTMAYVESNPVPTQDAARWLSGFALKGIGFDAFSIDKIVSAEKVTPETLPNHHILLGKEILLIENLTNLDKLQGISFQFQCFPIKIEKADGSPVRAVAIIG